MSHQVYNDVMHYPTIEWVQCVSAEATTAWQIAFTFPIQVINPEPKPSRGKSLRTRTVSKCISRWINLEKAEIRATLTFNVFSALVFSVWYQKCQLLSRVFRPKWNSRRAS